MKPSAPFVLLVLSVLLAGCETPLSDQRVWYQEGKTLPEIRRDWAESQLAARYAALNHRGPILATDNGYAMGIAAAAQRDAARNARAIGILTMESKGYQLVPFANLPDDAVCLKP